MSKKLSLKEAVMVPLSPIHEDTERYKKFGRFQATTPHIGGGTGESSSEDWSRPKKKSGKGLKSKNLKKEAVPQNPAPAAQGPMGRTQAGARQTTMAPAMKKTEPQEVVQLKNQANQRFAALGDVVEELRALTQRGDYQGATQYLGSMQTLSADIATLIQQIMQANLAAAQQGQAINPAPQRPGAAPMAAEGRIYEDHAMLAPESSEGQMEQRILQQLKNVSRGAQEAEHLINQGQYQNAFGYLSDTLTATKKALMSLKKYMANPPLSS